MRGGHKKASGFETYLLLLTSVFPLVSFLTSAAGNLLELRPIREATYTFDLFSGFGNPDALPCHLE